MALQIGIDVGGTFTDFFLWSADGRIETHKTLSTPSDPSVGVLTGLEAMAERRGESLGDFVAGIRTIVHGTTVTTNATLTRKGARTGLITTEGVRDALEMRRGIREEQYDNRYRNVVPLIPRFLRRTVPGRLDRRGREITPLDQDAVRAEARWLAAQGVEAVAICLMNAFANPEHENAAEAIVRQELPGAYLSVSSRVLPAIRFYDRLSTTAINAYIGPVLEGYLHSLTTKLAEAGFAGVLLIMQSNGGVARPEITRELPASTLLSGPAAGPRAAVAYTEPHGEKSCILIDMGGTSFEASLVRDGAATLQTEGEIDRLRLGLPMLGISTIGAGGGSIGWIDDGGLLRMGPESAGAAPGPACYGRGGRRPTCTDAILVLGYLDPQRFAGGRMSLDLEQARQAIERCVAEPLGLSVEQAAEGMYRVINANMAHGVREITIKRGLDPREFPLVVAGGAGPLHACAIAEELGIRTLLVPATASILCASGMLLSDLQHDYVRSYVTSFADLDPARLQTLMGELQARGEEELGREGVPASRIEHQPALDLRYVKQYHEVTVSLPREVIDRADLGAIARAFHREHDRLYGYNLEAEGTALELINVRLRSIGRTEKPALPRLAEGGADPEAAARPPRRAFVPRSGGYASVPVYDAALLRAGNVIDGPALIERSDTTVLVGAGFVARVDAHGSYLLSATGAGE